MINGQRLKQFHDIALNVLQRSLKPKYGPSHVQIEITTFCNMDCLSCGRRYLIGKGCHMTLEVFRNIYDQIQPTNVNLSGLGEPLLNPQVFKIIQYCKQNGSVVNFPTNLSVSNNVMEELVRSRIDQIKVSIDAASAQTYRNLRKKDKFHHVLENIRTIGRWKRDLGSNLPEVRFNFCLQKHNLTELPQLVELAKDLSVSSIYIQDLNYFSVEEEKNELCGFSQKQLVEVLEDTHQIARKLGIATNILNWKRNLKWLYNKTLPRENYQPNSIRCTFPWVSAFIDVNGWVKPCPVFVWDKSSGYLGNCLKTPFKNIWHGNDYQNLRREFKKGQRTLPICIRCVPPRLLDMQLIFTKMLAWRIGE